MRCPNSGFRVTYQDFDGIRHSVEMTAETLSEAAVLGMTTLRAAGWMDAPNLTIKVAVKAPETTHSIKQRRTCRVALSSGKSAREPALKCRLLELTRGGSMGGHAIE